MAESGGGPRVAIVVALIGLIGTLGAAAIANWEYLFPSNGNDDGPENPTVTDTTNGNPTTTTLAYLVEPSAVTLRPLESLDADTGRQDLTPGSESSFELVWICGAGDYEALRLDNATAGSQWADFRVTPGLEAVSATDLADGSYGAQTHPDTGYPDLFYEHKSNSPVVGTTYLIRTDTGNYAAVRIAWYGEAQAGVCRDVGLEVFSAEP